MTRLATLALVAAALIAGPAHAQSVCGSRESIIRQLETKYGETRRSLGVQQGRGVLEVYASSETGTWTIIITNPRGISCLIAAGEAFETGFQQTREGDPL